MPDKPKFRITTCSTCPFDVSDDSSRDKDHCKALGYNYPGSAGGFRVPPEDCPWRHDGVEFEFDGAEAESLYNAYVEREREGYRRRLDKWLEEAKAEGNKELVREIEKTKREMFGEAS